MYEELIKRLRDKSIFFGQIEIFDQMQELLLETADAIEELLKVASAMHTWIFLNTGDEQKAYDECGLSDEMNAALGYSGQFVAETPKEGE